MNQTRVIYKILNYIVNQTLYYNVNFVFSRMSFSTWFIDKKLTSVPIVNVSTKIVILGASRTALAFLNTLLFG